MDDYEADKLWRLYTYGAICPRCDELFMGHEVLCDGCMDACHEEEYKYRREAAAVTIQRYFCESYYNPVYVICRKRLLFEHASLVHCLKEVIERAFV